MQTSIETWLRVHERDSTAWWNPSWDGGIIRINKPPMLVWLNLFAWMDLSPETATMEQLCFRARSMSILLILAGLLATCWIGLSLRDLPTGLLSMLISGTFFLLIKQSHYATYDAQMMGWSTLAAACGIAAIHPLSPKSINRTDWLLWVLCGLFLGGSLMTKGPVGAVWVLTPLVVTMLCSPGKRIRVIMGILLSAAIGGALLTPWILHTIAIKAQTLTTLTDVYVPIDSDQFRPVYYYLALAALVFPWSFWWIPSWLHPFRNTTNRRLLFIPWCWFLLSFLFLCAFPMRNQRYLVPLLPAAGLMTALYLRDRWLTAPGPRRPSPAAYTFWGIALTVSIGLAAFIILQPTLLRNNIIDQLEITDISALAVSGAAVLLCVICWAGFHALRHRRYQLHFYLIGGWMIALTSFAYYGYSLAPHQKYDYRDQAETLTRLTQSTPVYYLRTFETNALPVPEAGFAMFAKKVIRPLQPDAIASTPRPLWLLVPAQSAAASAFQNQHLQPVTTLQDDDHTWTLLQFP